MAKVVPLCQAQLPPGLYLESIGVGHLLSETDRTGHTITLTYSNADQLSRVTDRAGRLLTFSYDGAGHVTSVSDPIGRTVKYSYDSK